MIPIIEAFELTLVSPIHTQQRDEIQVELDVVQSSIHKGKSKWHLKYCAADSPPGKWNPLTKVRALHVPSNLLTKQFKELLR